MVQAPSLYPQVMRKADLARKAGWKVDWWNGDGCFQAKACYYYVFSPLKKTLLAPFVDLGYSNLFSLLFLAITAPLLLLLSALLFKNISLALKGHELRLLGVMVAFGAVGAGSSYLLPPLELSTYAQVLVSAVVAALLSRRFPGPRSLVPYEARFATDDELTDMIEKFPSPSSVPLAERRNKPGFYSVKPGVNKRKELEHIIVVAPTRSGKGLHLQTVCYTWGGSLVVVDIKGEMYRRTSGHRANLGQNVYVLDPRGVGHRFDPFLELETDEEINSAVKLVLDTGDPENKIFEDRAAYAFIAMIAAARVRTPAGEPIDPSWTSTLVAVLSLMEKGSKGMKNFVENHPEMKRAYENGDYWAEKAVYNARMFYGDGSDEKYRESSWNILASTLQAMSTRGVKRMMSSSDFRAKDLIEKPATLYLRFNESELSATQSVLKLIEVSLFKAALRIIDTEYKGWSPTPILWAFDEAKAAQVPDLPVSVSTWAGRNMYALTYIQDLSQLEDAYEESGAQTILANCVQVFYVGNPNMKTAEHVSNLLGKTSVETTSYTYSREGSENRSFVSRELITPQEFIQVTYEGATRDDVIIIYRGRPPILGKKVTPFGQIKVPQVPPVPIPGEGVEA